MRYVERIEHIKLPLIKEYLKTIRSLAGQGRNYYHKYLIIPLSSWSLVSVEDELPDLERDIQVYSKLMDYQKLASSYKRAICRSVERDQFDLTVPGQMCMNFLKAMQESVDLAGQIESIQFVNLLRKPFTDYSQIEYKRVNTRFRKELARSGSEETIVAALETISREREEQISAERHLSQKLIADLKRKLPSGRVPELKRDVISYLLRTATPHVPELHREADPVIDEIEKRFHGFRKEVYESVAVIIYREVMKTIKAGEIKRAVLLISKYTVLFRGDPQTPHYHELDAFEKMFFEIIDRKNLWESV